MESFYPSSLPANASTHARKPLTQGQPSKRVTHFPSLKNQTMLACESLHLAQFCVHLEFELKVRIYTTRPFAIYFADAALTARPHFGAILTDGRKVYYEVSVFDHLSVTAQRRLSLTKECFGKAGLIFEHLTPALYQMSASTSALVCLYHQAHGGSAAQVTAIQDALASQDKRHTIRSLMQQGFKTHDIAFSIFFRHIKANLHQPVNLQTVVEIS